MAIMRGILSNGFYMGCHLNFQELPGKFQSLSLASGWAGQEGAVLTCIVAPCAEHSCEDLLPRLLPQYFLSSFLAIKLVYS